MLTAQGRRTLHATEGHTVFAVGNRVNNQRLKEAGFVVSKGWGAPRRLQENLTGSFEWIHGLAGNWNPILRDKHDLHPLCLLGGLLNYGTLPMAAEWEGELGVKSLETLLILQDKIAHNAENVNLYITKKNRNKKHNNPTSPTSSKNPKGTTT